MGPCGEDLSSQPGTGHGAQVQRATKTILISHGALMAAGGQVTGRARPPLSPSKKQGTPAMAQVWLPIPGQQAGGDIDSPGPTQLDPGHSGWQERNGPPLTLPSPFPPQGFCSHGRVTPGPECDAQLGIVRSCSTPGGTGMPRTILGRARRLPFTQGYVRGGKRRVPSP